MSVNVAEVFGQDVFNEAVMKERLPEVTYKQMVKLMNEGGEVTLELADIVAKAMKEWAIEKGATHYTHIFQPYIVSIEAEKHDSFADEGWQDRELLFRQRPDDGRAGCIFLPVRRTPCNLCSKRLYRMGCRITGICERWNPLYSDCILLLHRRVSGYQDSAAQSM